MAFKELIVATEIPETEDISSQLKTKVDMFQTVTSQFVEITEGMSTCLKYFKALIRCIPREATWSRTKPWILGMIEKFINDKIIDAEKLIIDYVDQNLSKTLNIIKDGETVLAYGNSRLLAEMLTELFQTKQVLRNNKNIHIILATEIGDKSTAEFTTSLASRGVHV